MGAIALPEELLPLLLAHRVEHHFSRSIFVTCSQVNKSQRDDARRDLRSEISSPHRLPLFLFLLFRRLNMYITHMRFYRGIILLTSRDDSSRLTRSSHSHLIRSSFARSFAVYDDRSPSRTRTRRQLAASIPNLPSVPQLESLIGAVEAALGGNVNRSAEDDRPTGSDRVAARSASGPGGDRSTIAAGALVKQDCI